VDEKSQKISILVPYEFARSETDIDWNDISIGISIGVFSAHAAVDHAVEIMKSSEGYSEDVLELASVMDGEQVNLDLVHELAPGENLSHIQETSMNKLLYFCMAWLFKTRSDYDDPLAAVETIYADLNYPSSIEDCVRYMPPKEPGCYGTDVLYENRQKFLENRRLELNV